MDNNWVTWVFSGCGVVFAVGVVKVIRNRFADPPSAQGTMIEGSSVNDSQIAVGTGITQVQETHYHQHGAGRVEDQWKITEPSPEQIYKEIMDTLPYDRPGAGAKYVGLRVVWKLRLSSFQNYEGAVRVNVFTAAPASNLVYFHMENLAPELKSATDKTLLYVKGTVRDVGVGIRLEDNPEIKIIKRS